MRLRQPFALLLAGLGFAVAGEARAQTPPDPLRLVPEQTGLFFEVKQPRRLVETATSLPVLDGVQELPPVKELLASTNARRGAQLLAYFEKELGDRWPVLLDRVVGGGVVLAVQFDAQPPTTLLVIQGRDEATQKRFARAALTVAEQELARREAKERPEKGTYRQVETVHVGKDFHAAVIGAALLVSNRQAGLQAALDRALDRERPNLGASHAVTEAGRQLPPDPLAVAWLNLEQARKAPQAKGVYQLPRDNFLLTVAYNGLLDVIGRAPYLCAGLYAGSDGIALRLQFPRGREGMSPAVATHVPLAGQPGSRPLLRPHGLLYSQSSYQDVGKFWEERAKLFTPQQIKSFEDFDKNSGRFLAGTRFSQLLTEAGPYQRTVATLQVHPGYKTTPQTRLPAFGFVVEMREPEKFRKNMGAVLRGAALIAGAQAGLKLTEEKHGDITLVGYRFPEGRPLKGDDGNFRFNFSPCFFTVRNQFAVSSTLELGHELADLLLQEQKEGVRGWPEVTHAVAYGEGGAEFLRNYQDYFITQAILDQAATPQDARREVQHLLGLVRRLGRLEFTTQYNEHDTRFELRLTPGAPPARQARHGS
jgi:hypothetical protein